MVREGAEVGAMDGVSVAACVGEVLDMLLGELETEFEGDCVGATGAAVCTVGANVGSVGFTGLSFSM